MSGYWVWDDTHKETEMDKHEATQQNVNSMQSEMLEWVGVKAKLVGTFTPVFVLTVIVYEFMKLVLKKEK